MPRPPAGCRDERSREIGIVGCTTRVREPSGQTRDGGVQRCGWHHIEEFGLPARDADAPEPSIGHMWGRTAVNERAAVWRPCDPRRFVGAVHGERVRLGQSLHVRTDADNVQDGTNALCPRNTQMPACRPWAEIAGKRYPPTDIGTDRTVRVSPLPVSRKTISDFRCVRPAVEHQPLSVRTPRHLSGEPPDDQSASFPRHPAERSCRCWNHRGVVERTRSGCHQATTPVSRRWLDRW